jgi:hypothetical protein
VIAVQWVPCEIGFAYAKISEVVARGQRITLIVAPEESVAPLVSGTSRPNVRTPVEPRSASAPIRLVVTLPEYWSLLERLAS